MFTIDIQDIDPAKLQRYTLAKKLS